MELSVRREKRDEIETVKTVSSLDDKKHSLVPCMVAKETG